MCPSCTSISTIRKARPKRSTNKVGHYLHVGSELATAGDRRTYKVTGQVFFSSADKFIGAFDFKEALTNVTIDLSRAHFWDITAVAALDKVVLKFRREGTAVEVLGLNAASAIADGVSKPEIRQRHDDLLESLRELEPGIRLLVIGKQGEASGSVSQHIGSHLESVIRIMHRPILITPSGFKAPQSLMLAFDGSATTRKGVEMLAASPLFRGLPVHLVMVGADNGDNRAQVDAASTVLATAGFTVHKAIRNGEVESTLHTYQSEHAIDLLVMGAYGHSRIRQFLVGSTTTSMLRTTSTPLVLIRVRHTLQLARESRVKVTEQLVVADRALHRRRCLVAIEALRLRFYVQP